VDRPKNHNHIDIPALPGESEDGFGCDGAAADPSRVRNDCAEAWHGAELCSALHKRLAAEIEKLRRRELTRGGVRWIKHPRHRGRSNRGVPWPEHAGYYNKPRRVSGKIDLSRDSVWRKRTVQRAVQRMGRFDVESHTGRI
jgi:hypothetical protein